VTGLRSSSEGGRGVPPDEAPTGLGSRIVAGGGLAFAALAASQLGTGGLVVVVAIAAAMAAAELARNFAAGGLNAPPLIYAASAALLPVAVYYFREPGLAGAAAALIILAAARWVLGRPGRAAVESIAAFVLTALYVGFCAGYLILLRLGGGARLILGLVIVVASFHAGRWLGDTRLRTPALAPHLGPTPTMSGALAGLAGALLGVAALLSLLDVALRPRLVIEIGLATGSALTLGMFAWALIRPERSARQLDEDRSDFPGGVLNALQAGLLSAPALFYALRLALR
jgi:CDP-diglyceride synthetase